MGNKYQTITKLSPGCYKRCRRISTRTIGLCQCESNANGYYLSVVLERSNCGNDTRETMKPFLDCIDSGVELEMDFMCRKYSVKLTSGVRLWIQLHELKKHTTLPTATTLVDLDTGVTHPTELFSSRDMTLYEAYTQKLQVLSPLLYCE